MIQHPESISTKKITFDGIQILRGIAASMVVFSHVSTAVATFNPNSQLLSKPFFHIWGSGGVDIFFVISGFIMYYTTVGKQWSPNSASTFLVKRGARIYPLYWIFTSLYLVIILSGLGLKNNPVNIPYTISSYLLIPGNKPGVPFFYHPILDQGWTLSFEIYFYIIFSAGIFFNQKARFLVFVTVVLGLLGWMAHIGHDTYPPITQLISSPLVIEFILGIIVAMVLISLKDKSHSILTRYKYLNVIVILAGIVVLLLTSVFIINDNVRVIIWGPVAALIVFAGALLPKLKSTVSKFLIYLGNASYSIYLTHAFFSIALGTLLKKGHLHQFSPNLIIVVFTLSSIFMCSFVYLVIEKPVMEFMKRHITILSENR